METRRLMVELGQKLLSKANSWSQRPERKELNRFILVLGCQELIALSVFITFRLGVWRVGMDTE